MRSLRLSIGGAATAAFLLAVTSMPASAQTGIRVTFSNQSAISVDAWISDASHSTPFSTRLAPGESQIGWQNVNLPTSGPEKQTSVLVVGYLRDPQAPLLFCQVSLTLVHTRSCSGAGPMQYCYASLYCGTGSPSNPQGRCSFDSGNRLEGDAGCSFGLQFR